MRKVCLYTATRAEWGLLAGLARCIEDSPNSELHILASGTHLSAQHGMTVSEIEAAGFKISEAIKVIEPDDDSQSVCQSMANALSAYPKALKRIDPNLIIILGDRYEAFCAATAAHVLQIPIAHIHGGESTEGAIDEAFRHAITKFSQIHFPAHPTYQRRIIQLGENPNSVHMVGSLGVENLKKIPLLGIHDLESSLGFNLDVPFFLVTFHPATLSSGSAVEHLNQLLHALEHFGNYKIILTKANADPKGNSINDRLSAFAEANSERCRLFDSLGLTRYLSAIKLCEAVVGNSSSGVIEAPALGVPTVNIGDRQKGREIPNSVINCDNKTEAIISAINTACDAKTKADAAKYAEAINKVDTANRILQIIESAELSNGVHKTFYDLPILHD